MQILFTKRKVHFIYIGLAAVSMLLAGVSYVRAQEMPAPTPQGEERADTVRTAVTERLAGLREEQQNRFINLVRNVFARMDAAITRLTNIADRIETRIETLKASGVDVTLATKPLEEAQSKLGEAKRRLDAVKRDAEDGLVSDAPRERFSTAREEFKAIRDLIRESFILLRESLAELRDAAIEQALNGRPATATVVNSASALTSTNE
jgi:hypothetical protein